MFTQPARANGTLTYTYDAAHNITKAVSGNLNMNMSYDAVGNVTQTKLQGNGNAAYMKTSATYTQDGNKVATSTDNLNNTTAYSYNNKGRLAATSSPVSNTFSAYNTIMNYSYDAAGRQTNCFTTGMANVASEYSEGNLVKMTRGGYINGNSTKQNQTYEFAYDAFGNTTETRVGDSNFRTLVTNEYKFNPNTLDLMTYGNGDKVAYTYDNLNRVKTKTIRDLDAANVLQDRYILTYFYDGSGRASKIVVQNGSKETISTITAEYDSLDRLIVSKETDGDGIITQSIKNVYDSKNRLTHYYYYDGKKTVFQNNQYNTNGSISTFRPTNGDRITFTYDALNRVSKKSVAHDSNANYTFSIAPTYQDGSATNQTTSLLSEYKYDYVNTDGVYDYNTYYTYDNLGNIVSTRYQTADGNGTYKQTNVGRYLYDKQNQLVLEEVYNDPDSTIGAYTKVYTYDTYGNIRNVKKYQYIGYNSPSQAFEQGTLLDTTEYTYGDGDWKDLLTEYDEQDITYDAIGNPLTYYNGTRYNMYWENGRQLKYATLNPETENEVRLTYTYDENGQRTSKQVGTVDYDYTYVGNQLVRVACKNGLDGYDLNINYDESGAPQSLYLDDVNNVRAKFYFVLNAQGDVVQLRESNNMAIANYSYDAWGKLLKVTDEDGNEITDANNIALRNPLLYRGYVYDAETGFYYLNSRYYDPETCRFINADTTDIITATPAALTDKNLFSYCDNNPVMRKDNGGEFWHLAIGAVIGGIIGGVTAALSGGDLGDVVIGVVSGGANGLLAASGAGVVVQAIANAGISMASNAASQIKNIATEKQDTFDTMDMLFDAAVGMVCGIAGGNGASYGNVAGIKSSGNQLTKKFFSGDNIRNAYSYYRRTAHRQGGEYVLTALRSSLGKSAAGSVAVTIKNRFRRRHR